jgi:SAM-dependent methyltransferase
MNHFKEYSKYYDLLYKDKDYLSEVYYIDNILEKLGKKNCTILDIGCGTGKHADLLDKQGYKMHGIDISETMLEKAISNYGEKLSFSKGDIRNFQIDKTFDVVTSLFHVMSYQTNNEDLEAAFKTVYAHLNPGGYFIFDCWYGPGVMNDPPVVRVKRMKDEDYEIVRIAEPDINYNDSIVDVHYQILIKNLINKQLTEIHEKHPMRFLFKNEIELLAARFNFTTKGFYSWMTFNEPSKDDWYVLFILQK